ncbi:hypothetical protein AYI70_g9239, partial [Smittium culicis]
MITSQTISNDNGICAAK